MLISLPTDATESVLNLRVTQKVTLERWTQPSGPLCLWQCFWWNDFYQNPWLAIQLDFWYIWKKLLWKPSQYALPKSYDDMRAEKTTFSRLSLVRGFLWHPSTGQNQAQPLLCSIRPYWVLKAFSHLARRQANFFCSPFLSNLSEKKSCWLYLSIQIWCVSRLDEGIGRVEWIMEISVF